MAPKETAGKKSHRRNGDKASVRRNMPERHGGKEPKTRNWWQRLGDKETARKNEIEIRKWQKNMETRFRDEEILRDDLCKWDVDKLVMKVKWRSENGDEGEVTNKERGKQWRGKGDRKIWWSNGGIETAIKFGYLVVREEDMEKRSEPRRNGRE